MVTDSNSAKKNHASPNAGIEMIFDVAFDFRVLLVVSDQRENLFVAHRVPVNVRVLICVLVVVTKDRTDSHLFIQDFLSCG